MDSRSLNRIVTLRQGGTTQDEIGQPIEPGAVLGKVWANVRFLNGTESLKSDQLVSISRASVRIRRRTDLDAGIEVLLGDMVLQVLAVLPDEIDRDHVDLACQSLNAGALQP